MKDYKDTLNLPQTAFPMRANLPQREPEFLKFWETINVYEKKLKKNKNSSTFILHDGPPYANGDIHLGHALNKILKDIVVRFNLMRGSFSPFVPGWDCHGLPVEHQLLKELGLKKSQIEPLEFRRKAREYALHYVDIQKEQFKRLAVLGKWDAPYLTLEPKYEYYIFKSLAVLVERGYLYKDVKPVNWCIECETALAEAEVEYKEHTSDSIYVKFKLAPDSSLRKKVELPEETYFLIWTTTPWTLISNVALAVAKEEEYLFLETESKEVLILAQKLKAKIENNLNVRFDAEIAKFKGYDLENELALHPFFERKSLVVTGDFVSLDEGTGCVHIAPGHGEEDYLLGKEKNLDIIMPLNDKGIFENVEEFSGFSVWKANDKVIEVLREKKSLLKAEKILHSYPHCWRCKSPVVFRATAQWFMSMDKNNLRQKLLKTIKSVNWIPELGLQRIQGMLETRPDWCLSRQRYWGVAIPALRCRVCNESILDKNVIMNLAKEVAKYGSDIWFKEDYRKFLPPGFKCIHCGNENRNEFEKETDIIDVWFESGISHQAVLTSERGLSYPADLYLEGSDQHRGWFQTSLITGLGVKDEAPYRSVLTHGFVVDGEGRKMSKSLGNVISPFEVINKYGADVLRLWVISRDFSQDLRISHKILSQVVEAYRKIRNTFRFLISNLYDFKPEEKIDSQDLDIIDKWIYIELNVLGKEIIRLYERYAFHEIFKKLYSFMNEKLSSIYLDVLKDRLYTFHPQDSKRKSSQTVLYRLTSVLAKLIAPILPFTAEDVWKHIVYKDEEDIKFESVHLGNITPDDFEFEDTRVLQDFRKLLEVRAFVMKAIEIKREESLIGSPLEAKVSLKITLDKFYNFLDNYKSILKTLFIVSEVEVEKVKEIKDLGYKLNSGEEMEVEIVRSQGKKCARCWNYSLDVGADVKFNDVCGKCLKVLRVLER